MGIESVMEAGKDKPNAYLPRCHFCLLQPFPLSKNGFSIPDTNPSVAFNIIFSRSLIFIILLFTCKNDVQNFLKGNC